MNWLKLNPLIVSSSSCTERCRPAPRDITGAAFPLSQPAPAWR